MNRAIYFDASALIKRYIQETGSARVDHMFGEPDALLCTASLTYAEVYATLHRLRRDSLLRATDLTRLTSAFESDWRAMAILEFTHETRRLIPKTIAQVGLRGADLVHLVTALAFNGPGVPFTFLTADKRLLHAALDSGLHAEDPAEQKSAATSV